MNAVVYAALVMLVVVGIASITQADAAVERRGQIEDRNIQQVGRGSNRGGKRGESAGGERPHKSARRFRRVQAHACRIANVPGGVSRVHLLVIRAEPDAVCALLPAQSIAELVGTRLMELGSVHFVAGAVREGGGADHGDDTRQTGTDARKLALR